MLKFRFSILTLLLATAVVAIYLASRDTDLLSLNMNGNKILPMPVDSFQQLPHRWGLLNPQERPLDRVLYRQCLKFEKLSPSDQAAVRKSIGDSTEASLWTFARRSSVFALRNKDPQRIRAGLIAFAMMPTEHDFRDVYMTLGLLGRAAKELNVDSSVFEETAAMSRSHMAKLMKEMVGRDPSGTKSRNFVETEFGIGYVATGDGPFNSSKRLAFDQHAHSKGD